MLFRWRTELGAVFLSRTVPERWLFTQRAAVGVWSASVHAGGAGAAHTHPSRLQEPALPSHAVLDVHQLLQVLLGRQTAVRSPRGDRAANLPPAFLTICFLQKWNYRMRFQRDLSPGILHPESLLPALQVL